MHQDHWQTDNVAVVSPDGNTLYTGGDAAAHADDAWDVDGDAVGFGDDGNLTVSDDIPTVAGPSGEDWGGSDVDASAGGADSSGGGFFSDFFGGGGDGGGGDGGGASCGSSCGGGCGGGCGSG